MMETKEHLAQEASWKFHWIGRAMKIYKKKWFFAIGEDLQQGLSENEKCWIFNNHDSDFNINIS